MSLDRSLKTKSSLTRHRNVLSRAERLALLVDGGKWDSTHGALHLPKVSHRKARAVAKKKETPTGEAAAAATPGTAAPTPAAADAKKK